VLRESVRNCEEERNFMRHFELEEMGQEKRMAEDFRSVEEALNCLKES